MRRKPTRYTRRPRITPIIEQMRVFSEGELPSYKKWEALSHFITERGKILPRINTGLDAKTQRRLTREIKRARHLALLPYVVRPV